MSTLPVANWVSKSAAERAAYGAFSVDLYCVPLDLLVPHLIACAPLKLKTSVNCPLSCLHHKGTNNL